MKQTLWTKNFTLITVASGLGAIGGIAGSYQESASFAVFSWDDKAEIMKIYFMVLFFPVQKTKLDFRSLC